MPDKKTGQINFSIPLPTDAAIDPNKPIEHCAPYQIIRRDRSYSSVVTIDLTATPTDAPLGRIINDVIVSNLGNGLDFHASQFFIRRGAHIYLAHLQSRRADQHAGEWVIDDRVTLEPFA